MLCALIFQYMMESTSKSSLERCYLFSFSMGDSTSYPSLWNKCIKDKTRLWSFNGINIHIEYVRIGSCRINVTLLATLLSNTAKRNNSTNINNIKIIWSKLACGTMWIGIIFMLDFKCSLRHLWLCESFRKCEVPLKCRKWTSSKGFSFSIHHGRSYGNFFCRTNKCC